MMGCRPLHKEGCRKPSSDQHVHTSPHQPVLFLPLSLLLHLQLALQHAPRTSRRSAGATASLRQRPIQSLQGLGNRRARDDPSCPAIRLELLVLPKPQRQLHTPLRGGTAGC